MNTFLKSLRAALMAGLLVFTESLMQAAPGDLDPLDASVLGTTVYATAVQPDGKTIIAGQFTSVLGQSRNNIARLNADGTLDMGFDPSASSTVYSVGVQADGKVVLGGAFTSLQPNGAGAATTRQYIARVNADGTLDTGFDPNPNSTVFNVAVQADGKVLLCGGFIVLQPNGAASFTMRNYLARVDIDGTLDMGFDPNANNSIFSMALQTDGKVLLCGNFTSLQPNGASEATIRERVARVNADGTLDTSFDPKANSYVFCVAVQADGKVVLGGAFTSLQPNGAGAPTERNSIARMNADGTLDMSFDPNVGGGIGAVHSMAVQADGKVLLGGFFFMVHPNGASSPTARHHIARVNPDGTLDTGFDPKASSHVESMALQADGQVLLGGNFTTLQPNDGATATARNKFARLVNDPATQTLTAPSIAQALWSRSGAGPELTRVTFEQSTDGGTTYTPLAAGTRVGTSANWQFTGLALPASGHLRARGWTAGGVNNGSSGIIEQVAAFSFDTTTLTPTLTTPAANSFINNTVNVSFSLPEAALPGSVTLTFVGPLTRTLVLAASQESAGAHSFSFDVGAPAGAAEVESGLPLEYDGVYSVTLSYRDALGNPAATAVAANVTLDTVLPVVGGDFSPVVIAEGALPDYRSQATGDAVSFSQSPAPGTVVPVGIVTVFIMGTDAAGNVGQTYFYVRVLPAGPVRTVLGTKGAAVPGAGVSGSGIPAGAVWATFGVPSVNDAGQAVVLASFKVGRVSTTAILGWELANPAGMKVVARKGQEVGDDLGVIISAF